MSITEGIDGNVAIVERYVDAIVADVRAFLDRRPRRRHRQGPRGRSPTSPSRCCSARDRAVLEPRRRRSSTTTRCATRTSTHRPSRSSADFLKLIGQRRGARADDRARHAAGDRRLARPAVGRFTDLLGRRGALFADAWAAISPANLPNLIDNLTSLADRAFDLMQDVGAFASHDPRSRCWSWSRSRCWAWLSEHAHEVPGFHLLTVILEKDPFTGEAVPRTAENLIKGFITLLPGGEADVRRARRVRRHRRRRRDDRVRDDAAEHLVGPDHRHVPGHLEHRSRSRACCRRSRRSTASSPQFGDPLEPDLRVRQRRHPGGRHADPAADELPDRAARATSSPTRRRPSTTSRTTRSGS